jgi:hypothetical protein
MVEIGLFGTTHYGRNFKIIFEKYEEFFIQKLYSILEFMDYGCMMTRYEILFSPNPYPKPK